MHCSSGWKVGLLSFLIFIGALIGSLSLNPLGDIWGRATTYRLSMTISIIANLFLVLTQSYGMLCLSLFLFGFASTGINVVGYIWLMEHLPIN